MKTVHILSEILLNKNLTYSHEVSHMKTLDRKKIIPDCRNSAKDPIAKPYERDKIYTPNTHTYYRSLSCHETDTALRSRC